MTQLTEIDVASLYNTHRLSLVRLAALLVDDTASAEDVVHDAFIALHQHQHRLREPKAAIGYLRTSVVNNARGVLRKRQTVRRHLSQVRLMDAEPADSELLLSARHQEVLAAVRQLPPRQQEVLALRYWSELSEAEIAEALGISRGAVKSNASRGIDKLEVILGESR
ncbi:MAG: SigE family RNA polymerase sigma factor [Actinomycetota bacterium]|nr:SigE family RNA polymerase sigma factor [Actinomycetota bacterium]MDQ2956722.1 SigE family RNA polymerase sigma factor [Actinomycetota bacterium]